MRFERPAARVRVRRPLLAAAGICAIVLGLGGASLSLWLVDGRAVSLFGAGIAVAVAVAGFSSWSHGREERSGQLLCDPRGVFVDGRCLVARRRIAHTFVRRDDRGITLCLVGTTRHAEIALESERDARAVLEAAALDPGRFVARFWLFEQRRSTAPLAIASVAFLLLGASAGTDLLFAPALIALIALVSCRVPCAVGADGLSIGGLLRRRVVPFGSIRRATRGASGLSIELRDGSTLVFASEGAWRPASDANAFFELLDARLSPSRAAETSALAESLARGERSAAAWLREVRRLPQRRAPFRAADVPNEALVRIVEDPLVSADVRVAAAAALETADDGDRARVRAVAEACVAPELRAALTAAIAGDDQAVVAALGRAG